MFVVFVYHQSKCFLQLLCWGINSKMASFLQFCVTHVTYFWNPVIKKPYELGLNNFAVWLSIWPRRRISIYEGIGLFLYKIRKLLLFGRYSRDTLIQLPFNANRSQSMQISGKPIGQQIFPSIFIIENVVYYDILDQFT